MSRSTLPRSPPYCTSAIQSKPSHEEGRTTDIINRVSHVQVILHVYVEDEQRLRCARSGGVEALVGMVRTKAQQLQVQYGTGYCFAIIEDACCDRGAAACIP